MNHNNNNKNKHSSSAQQQLGWSRHPQKAKNKSYLLPKIVVSFTLLWLLLVLSTSYYHLPHFNSSAVLDQKQLFKTRFRETDRDKNNAERSVVAGKQSRKGSAMKNNILAKKKETKKKVQPKTIDMEDNTIPFYHNEFAWSNTTSSNNKFGPAMSACLLIKDENPRLVEWLAYHYTVVKLRYLVVAIDPDSLTYPQDILNRWKDIMNIQTWKDEHYMNQTELTLRLSRRLHAKQNNDMEEWIQLHRERQKTFLAQCNLYHQAQNRTWVLHIDVDEYISYNYVHDEQEPSPASQLRRNLTPSTAIFDYFHSVQPPAEACVGMVRVMFGPKTMNNVTKTIDKEEIHLDTLSYYYHENLATLGLFGKQKVIMDVSRIHPSLLQPIIVFSIHTPIMRPRHVCPVNYHTAKAYSESILRVHHYIGSWESYFSKVDVRRDKEIFIERSTAASKYGPIHDVKGWYDSFVQLMGSADRANQMLAGAGLLEKEWTTIVAKQQTNKSKTPICALLFFTSNEETAAQKPSLLWSSLQANVLQENPSCEIFVHSFAEMKESIPYFPMQRTHFLVSTFQQQHDENYRQVPLKLRKQWHSILSVWNFMELFEQNNWKRFQRIGLFSYDMVYYDPIPITNNNEDAVMPSAILSDGTDEEERWGSALFYGARDVAKIWATDRLKSVEGYQQWQSSATNSTSFLVDYLLNQKWRLLGYVAVRNICFRPYATITEEGQHSKQCTFAAQSATTMSVIDKVPGLVVLGMHRSGTSLLSGLLVKGLSYVVPGKVMVANNGNQYGYFENDNVSFQNDVWLNEQSMHWNKLNIRTDEKDSRVIVGGFDPNFSCITDYCAKAKHKKLNYFRNRKIALLDFNNSTLPWLLKDPRLCITLSMWLPSLRGAPPAVLFTFRNPLEVAKSLARRKINNVKLLSDGMKLWIWYNRLSLLNSQSLCRVVTSNEAVIRDPVSEISRINEELTKCGLPSRPLNATALLDFFHADIMHVSENNNNQKKNDATKNNEEDCIIPPLESGLLITDSNLQNVYMKAMTVFCDLKNGKAFTENYLWPLLPSVV